MRLNEPFQLTAADIIQRQTKLNRHITRQCLKNLQFNNGQKIWNARLRVVISWICVSFVLISKLANSLNNLQLSCSQDSLSLLALTAP